MDLGYLGFQKDYNCLNALIPFKKPRKSAKNPNPELSNEQKLFNREVSKKRIFVENAIAGMKRYYLIANRIRIKKEAYRNDIILISAALWNFYLS